MADDFKEFKFDNNFYNTDQGTDGAYKGEFVFDFTTGQIASGSVNVDGVNYDKSNVESVSGPGSNGQYTVEFQKSFTTGDTQSGVVDHQNTVTFQFTGTSPTSFDEVSTAEGSSQQTANPVYTYTDKDTLIASADQRQVQVVNPPVVSVSINPAGYDDTGVQGDSLTSDPTVTLSGTDKNASAVEVFEGSTDLGAATRAADGTWSLTTKLPDGSYNDFSAVATSTYTGQTAEASTSTGFTIDTALPSVTVDPTTAGFKNGVTPILTGTVSADANGVSGVEIYNGDQDLGAATVNTNGTWTFTNNLGSGDYADLTAVATADSGTTASAAAGYELVTGVTGQPYRALEYDYAADGSYGYTEYSKLGKPLVTATNNGDGTHTIQTSANGQDLYSAGNDTLTGSGSSETYVFFPNLGHDVVTDFDVAGAGHDYVDLSNTHIHTLAQALNSITTSGGNATIHLDKHDTVTLDGVTKAQLKAHPGDFLLT